MKKTMAFLRSMKFGLLLLLPVLALSILGSVIPQGESESAYASLYPQTYHLILGLGLDRVFSSAAFLILCAMFGLNLTLCTVTQFHAVPARREREQERALSRSERTPLTEKERTALDGCLRLRLWRREQRGEQTLYSAPWGSWYGSVITHLAILGVMLGAVGVFALSSAVDYSILPGTNTLPDGTVITLTEFRIRDEEGRIDYASTLEVTEPSGRSSGVRQIRVNHPLRFGSRKYYQQSYGVAGVVTVTVKDGGETRTLYMREQGLISVGGTNGIWYDDVYPGYVLDSEGNLTLITQTAGEYAEPVYYVLKMEDGAITPMMIFPGEDIELEDAVYLFSDPIQFPGVRVKTTPPWVYALLYLSFAALMAGLYLCFFAPAAAVAVDERGCAVAGKRSEEGIGRQIEEILKKERETHA